MTKNRIEVVVTHHGATKALSRILQLLEFSADGYGVDSLTYTVLAEDGVTEVSHWSTPKTKPPSWVLLPLALIAVTLAVAAFILRGY